MRIGHGFDVHKFGGQGPIVIGGVEIDYAEGLIAHSDGDVLIHALCDAILGALCLADIGNHFPDTDGEYENISSRILLRHVVGLMRDKGYQLGNADITVVAQAPKMAPHLLAMRKCLAEDIGSDIDQINVKATTTEKLGYAGRKEGIAVHAVVLLENLPENKKVASEREAQNELQSDKKFDHVPLNKSTVTSEQPDVVIDNTESVQAIESALPSWSYLYEKPISTGDLRTEMVDFKVFEQLPIVPCGEGEHVFIKVRKTGENTAFIARALAKYFNVKENLVSYAGLKDRFAVTEQWFAAHLPGKKEYTLDDLLLDGVEVLQVERHNKKLRIGALTGNSFELTLRNVTDVDDLSRRWYAIQAHGVPNYFGEQRFGINGGNIHKALSLFSGNKVNDKKKRGMYLSASRSLIFNQILSERIALNKFDTVLDGDVMMLSGTQSVFVNDTENDLADESLQKRLHEGDLDITAPMWGSGDLMTKADAYTLEREVAKELEAHCDGLPRFGLKQERRKIRLTPKETDIQINDNGNGTNTVKLSFFLPAGCYATTILRELLNYQDLTERKAR